MSHQSVLDAIEASGVVAVIRMKEADRLLKVIDAVRRGGVQCIEITMTVPGAVGIIAELTQSVPENVFVGAGTVTDAETARAVIDSGAKFVVGPVLSLDVLEACRARDVAGIPGCFTPTEIHAAHKAGAEIIKLFPATSIGPKYIKDLLGPFPHLKLMPTGGVTIDNVGEWIRAGAVAVGIGSDLLDKKAISEERYDVLSGRARQMVQNILDARQSIKK